MKKIIAILLTVVMLVSTVYVTHPEVKEVQASETSLSNETTEAVGAKLDMLTIKMQALEDTYQYKEQNATKLRIVASVDSLDYATVGFKIWYDEDITNGVNGGLNETPTKNYSTSTVFERITAGITYNYSPKVIDTSSEYFVTVTLTNILEKNWNKNFYIKAYYVTTDGKTVEGGGRYFNLNKANSNETINIPIEMTEEQYNNMTEVKVADTTYQIGTQAEKAYYDGRYAHLNINVGNKTALKSASLVQVGDGDDAPKAIYRNLLSGYTVDASGNTAGDTSWYDDSQSEFIIANEADLYGLASIYTTNTGSAMNIFAGKTFYLVKDMEMNKVVNSEFQTQTLWKGIGKYIPSHVINFAGTFDGQGHTISGIYRYHDANAHATEVSNKGVYAGLFNRTKGAEIKNFTLENSHFEAINAANEYLGAITGYDEDGSYENISVKETVAVQGYKSSVGGFVGSVSANTTKISFKSCEFKGVVSASSVVGGFVGNAPLGSGKKLYFDNCFVGGTVTASTGSKVGGFCGSVSKQTIHMENCISVATKDNQDALPEGFFGAYEKGVQVTYNNAYTTCPDSLVEDENTTTPTTTANGKTSIKSELTVNDLTGESAFINTALNFKDVWTVVDGKYPELRIFADVVKDEPKVNRVHFENGDLSWYDLAGGVSGGTKENPYILKDAEDLIGMALKVKAKPSDFIDTYFKVANDIAVNYDNSIETNRVSWTPIGYIDNAGSFKGNFDGQGHTISGLYCPNNITQFVGLFAGINNGNKDVVIENFTLTNCNFAASHITGAVAGNIYGGTFRNIRVADTVNVKGNYAIGGVAGRITPIGSVSLEQCVFEGNVEGNIIEETVAARENKGVGGMIGLLYRQDNPNTTHISNCLVKGTITNPGYNTGGICGYVAKSHAITVENTIVVSEFHSDPDKNSGGIVGYNVGKTNDGTETISNNVYITHKNALNNGNSKASSVTKITDANQLKGNDAYVNTLLDFDKIWTVVKDEYPELRICASKVNTAPKELNRKITADKKTWQYMNAGTSEDPYVLKDAADLLGLAEESKANAFAGKFFVLPNDITVNNNNATATNRLSWTMIGGSSKALAFKGNFDGQEHAISGIYYNNASVDMVGLFKRLGPEAVIKNVKLADFDISAHQNVGALGGYANGGTYSNIQIGQTVEVKGRDVVGGFIGRQAPDAAETTFENCIFAGSVEATGLVSGESKIVFLGGFVGRTWQGQNEDGSQKDGYKTTFKKCMVSNEAIIQGQGTATGGYCGSIEQCDADFLNCKFEGTVENTELQTGGFLGVPKGNTVSMEQCQFDGTVVSTGRRTGGFIGAMDSGSPSNVSMRYCLSTGTLDVSGYTETVEVKEGNDTKIESHPNVGGFVGRIMINSEQCLDITNCVSIATIKLADIEGVTTYGPIVGNSDTKESTTIDQTYVASEGKGTNIIGQFEQLSANDMKGADAQNNMQLLDWSVWEVTDNYPTLKFNATGITIDNVTASDDDIALLTSNYSQNNVLYQGEMHAHAKTYGNGPGSLPGDDGNTTLTEWKKQLEDPEQGLDFAASLDHNQTHHFGHDDWEVSKFLYGTEAGTEIKNGIIGTGSENDKGEFHYSMLFKTKEQLETILNNKQFGFTYVNNMFNYPDFETKTAFDALVKAVTDNGGFFVRVHPKVSSYSTNVDDYWFGPNTAYTGLEVLYKDTEDEAQNRAYTGSNYDLWKALLNKGYRVYATAGSDTHYGLNVRALTSIYSSTAAADDKGVLIDQLRAGNFTAGPIGIQMSIGNMAMGGHSAAFTEGQKVVVKIGEFQEKTFKEDHKYMVSVYNDKGVVYTQRLTMNAATCTPENGTFAIPVDTASEYYRVEVYDMTENTWFAFGNPIWNGEKTYQ